MSNAQKKAVSSYRQRLRKLGMVRLEVHVNKSDVKLVREVVSALADPNSKVEMRALLRERFGADRSGGLKALLAGEPLECIELTRSRDFGRTVEL